MSYSFNLKASNKAAAIQEVADKLEEVVATQPIHEVDKAAVQKSCGVFYQPVA
jgi:mannitol/fructose-specific phosphotransferase system IIA component (Ntr-type)